MGEERRSLPPTSSEVGVLTDSGLAGKAVIVTGGSRGIGRAIVDVKDFHPVLRAQAGDNSQQFLMKERQHLRFFVRGAHDAQERRLK